LIILASLFRASNALAQVNPVTIIDPMPNITAILGSAQMDGDPAEEIALVFADERLIIVDSSSGLVEFDSDPYGWSYVYPPRYNLRYDTEQPAVICLTDMPISAPDDVPQQRSGLDQNYPNPFNPITTIDFHLASAGKTVMKIYDVRGNLVRTLLNEPVSAGSHSVIWDGTDNSGRKVVSGSYFYQLESNGLMMTKKSLLVK